MSKSIDIELTLNDGKKIHVLIYARSAHIPVKIEEAKAMEWAESPNQLQEGNRYEYKLTDGYELRASEIVQPSGVNRYSGTLVPRMHVGRLEIDVLDSQEQVVGCLDLEVCSRKMHYREDYRKMLEYITARCTDLLMRHSPVRQLYKIDKEKDAATLYQRFMFVDSMVRSEQFLDALHRINSMPVKRWETVEEHTKYIQSSPGEWYGSASGHLRKNRSPVPDGHPLSKQFESLPDKVVVHSKRETADIPENRFVKFVLETFMQFCLEVERLARKANKGKKEPRMCLEAAATAELLAQQLYLPIFKEVSRLDMIPLHSPVLQRKEGYREILQTYLMFDAAARLVWEGGDDVYKGGKRDVAVLYEYWLFFQLLDLLEEVFSIKPESLDKIIGETRDGLALTLKRGNHTMIDGVFNAGSRKLHVLFSYNRRFGEQQYPFSGSWTQEMRPDYTLSLWPEGLTQEDAEEREMIVHIHFDAKYRVDKNPFTQKVDLGEEKKQQSAGEYKRDDLLKMHAYKDAIRRTGGAYVLYPGNEQTENKGEKKKKHLFQHFHEIMPGLGAFAISPQYDTHTGLKKFLLEVVDHFLNRASQHEQFSYHTYQTFHNPPGPALREPLPTDDGTELPGNTYVLVGHYHDADHLAWIQKKQTL
ncbi:MAG: DUF2357 domain-containing protein [Tannerellaceae bacterium]|nr:DUF2357 domain-containing protein [Tannerellaceae bacterium]